MVVPFLLHAHHHIPSLLRGGLPLLSEPDDVRPAIGRVRDTLDEPLPFQCRDQQTRRLLRDLRLLSEIGSALARTEWLSPRVAPPLDQRTRRV